MNTLLDKIQQLHSNLESQERNAQVLEICALLNTSNSIAPTAVTRYKLKPLLVPHLIQEGILAAEKLQVFAVHPICSDFLKALFREHYSGATEISPTMTYFSNLGALSEY